VSGSRSIDRDVPSYFQSLEHLLRHCARPPLAPARGPSTDWGQLVQLHDDRDVLQAAPDELPSIDIHSL
jgi:hypothetical protein